MAVYQGQKLEKYIRGNGISVGDLAGMLNVNRQTVYQYFNSKNLSSETVNKILTALNVSIRDIFTNDGSYSNPRLEASPIRLYPDPLENDDKNKKIIQLPDGTIGLRVPIVPERAYAGYMRGFSDPEYYDDLEDILIGVDKEPGGTYLGFEVVGDSMI